MPRKSSSRALREPEYASSSTSVPFNPAGDMHPDMARHRKYGSRADSKSAIRKTNEAISRVAPHPVGRGGLKGSGGAKAAHHGQAPSATSLQGSLGIIENAMGGDRHRSVGIPGIISSTSLGPEQRQRLVAGIIESPMEGSNKNSGAVHSVMGHDATAYNEGMVHIRGSQFK